MSLASFSLPYTLLPALVINNQVISMPRALHTSLWTSDVVRRRASLHSYRFSYAAVPQMKQQHLALCFQSWMFTSAQQLGTPLNTPFERGISKTGRFSPGAWLLWKSWQTGSTWRPKSHTQFQLVFFSLELLRAERQRNVGSCRSVWCRVRGGIKLHTYSTLFPFQMYLS